MKLGVGALQSCLVEAFIDKKSSTVPEKSDKPETSSFHGDARGVSDRMPGDWVKRGVVGFEGGL